VNERGIKSNDYVKWLHAPAFSRATRGAAAAAHTNSRDGLSPAPKNTHRPLGGCSVHQHAGSKAWCQHNIEPRQLLLPYEEVLCTSCCQVLSAAALLRLLPTNFSANHLSQ
jgi:hypothetical protein